MPRLKPQAKLVLIVVVGAGAVFGLRFKVMVLVPVVLIGVLAIVVAGPSLERGSLDVYRASPRG